MVARERSGNVRRIRALLSPFHVGVVLAVLFGLLANSFIYSQLRDTAYEDAGRILLRYGLERRLHVEQWTEDHLNDAHSFAGAPRLEELMIALSTGVSSSLTSDTIQHLAHACEAEMESHDLSAVQLFDTTGAPILPEFGEWCDGEHEVVAQSVAQVLKTGVSLSVCDSGCNECDPGWYIIEPVWLARLGTPCAALAEKVEADDRLIEGLEAISDEFRTIETAILHFENDEGASTCMLAPHHDIDDVVHLAGVGGALESGAKVDAESTDALVGVDRENIAVLAQVFPLSQTEHQVVVTVERDEIDEQAQKSTSLASAGLAFLMLGTLSGSEVLRRRFRRTDVRIREVEFRNRVLDESIGLLTQHANDIIFLLDPVLRVAFLNERAAVAYGIREGYSGSFLGLLPAQDRERETFRLIESTRSGGSVWESVHVRLDGSEFPVEISARSIVLEGVAFIQLIIRDITERETERRRLEIAHTKLRELASEITRVEQRERRLLASTLHDGVGQSLAVLSMYLEVLAQQIEDEMLSKAIMETRYMLDLALRDTRALTYELSPPVLYELGLVEALDWLAEELSTRHETRFVALSEIEHVELEDDLKAAIFTAVRELCVNVTKHAHAPNATIGVRFGGGVLAVEVSDDGVGLPADYVERGNPESLSFGLFSIRERMSVLGGAFEMGSNKWGGVTATIQFDVPDPTTHDHVTGQKDDT